MGDCGDFVEDPVSRNIGGSGGIGDGVLSVLQRLLPRIYLVRRVWLRDEVKGREGEM